MDDNLLAPLDTLSEDIMKVVVKAVMLGTKQGTEEFVNILKRTTPVRTGGLLHSIKIEEVNQSSRKYSNQKVGYRVRFDGYSMEYSYSDYDILSGNAKGSSVTKFSKKRNRPYQVIANALNHGWIMDNGTHIPHFKTSNGQGVVEDKEYYQFIKKALYVLRKVNDYIAEYYDKLMAQEIGERYG